MTDAEARAICINAGYSPLNVDVLCKHNYKGDWQAFAAAAQEPDWDAFEDDLANERA